MSYVVAWSVLALAAGLIAFLIWRSLRRFTLLAGLVASLIVVWALTPIELQSGEYAPALMALLFRLFLERGADAATPATLLFFSTLIVLVTFVGLYVRRRLGQGFGGLGRSKSTKEGW